MQNSHFKWLPFLFIGCHISYSHMVYDYLMLKILGWFSCGKRAVLVGLGDKTIMANIVLLFPIRIKVANIR